jgi:hypothetical protein
MKKRVLEKQNEQKIKNMSNPTPKGLNMKNGVNPKQTNNYQTGMGTNTTGPNINQFDSNTRIGVDPKQTNNYQTGMGTNTNLIVDVRYQAQLSPCLNAPLVHSIKPNLEELKEEKHISEKHNQDKKSYSKKLFNSGDKINECLSF